MKRLRLDDAARADLLHEVRYLESARRGIGRKFHEAVEDAFARIRRNPMAGPEVEEGCRRVRVDAFKFSVVYREEETEIIVFVIRADHRIPGYWRSRTR